MRSDPPVGCDAQRTAISAHRRARYKSTFEKRRTRVGISSRAGSREAATLYKGPASRRPAPSLNGAGMKENAAKPRGQTPARASCLAQHADDEMMPRPSNTLATRTSILCRPGKSNGDYPGSTRDAAGLVRAEMRIGPGSEAGTTGAAARRAGLRDCGGAGGKSGALTPWRVRCQTSRGTSSVRRRPHWGV